MDIPKWFKDVYGSLSDEPDHRKIKYLWAEVSRHLDGQQIRIEALRVAATASGGRGSPESLITLAKMLAAWLETGER